MDINVIEQKQQIDTYIKLLNVPPLYKSLTFNDYQIYEDSQKPVFDQIIKYCDNFLIILKSHRNALFLGRIGNGKTMLAYIIAQTLIYKGFKVRFFKFDEMIDSVRKTWSKPEIDSDHYVKSFAISHLLIVDEVGRDRITDDQIRIFSKIFEYRYEHKRPIMLIGNINFTQIEEIFGERISSRLQQNKPELFAFTWADFRRRH